MSGRTRHVPLRRCVACRDSLPKAQLERLVKGESGWAHDASGRGGGRGTWICHACLERLDERSVTRALARTFRQDSEQVRALLLTLRLRVAASAAARDATDTSGTPTAAREATVTPPNDARHGGTHG